MLRILRTSAWIVVASCFWIGFSGVAWSTVIVSQTLEQMVHSASRIVRGRVVQKTFLWGPGKRYIYTDLRVQVLEQMKGETQAYVTVRKLGGVMDGVAAKVPGTASYRLQEEVVLFLETKRLNRYYFVMGLAAGKYEAVRRSGQVWLKRDVHGLTFHKPLGQKRVGTSIEHLRYTEAPLLLSKLRQKIQQTQQVTLPKPAPVAVRRRPSLSLGKTLTVVNARRQPMLRFLQRLSRQKRSTPKPPGAVLPSSPSVLVRRPGRILRPVTAKKERGQ